MTVLTANPPLTFDCENCRNRNGAEHLCGSACSEPGTGTGDDPWPSKWLPLLGDGSREASYYRAIEQRWHDAGWPGIGDVVYLPDGTSVWYGVDGRKETYSAQEEEK